MLFDNLTTSETSPALQAVEREMSPRLAAHRSAIYLHDKLFAKIDELHRRLTTPTPPEGAQFAPWDGPAALRPGELRLNPEQMRLLERVHLDFVREGARLSSAAKLRHAAIVERLAELSTRFSQNVLADEADYRLLLRNEADLAGLPKDLRAAAREAAHERGEENASAITLSRSLVVPFLTFSSRRDLREQAFNAWIRRGENDGDHDNRPVAREILALRAEQARLHGYENYADYALVDRMAGTPDAVAQLLTEVWEPAKARAEIERDALRATALAHGETHLIEPWDWRYYAEKVRSANYGFDDAALKPYLALDRMLGAAFDTAHRLFGLNFVEQSGIPTYHPDVRVFEVRDRDDQLVGVFLSDNFAKAHMRETDDAVMKRAHRQQQQFRQGATR
jgi:peptidyl-dipeptidase Dcp